SNSNGILVLNKARRGALSVDNDAAITSGAGASSRAIAVSTSGAAAGGAYTMTVDNSGDFDLDTLQALGITVFATRDDNAAASVTNSGDMTFDQSTSLNSVGISINLNGNGAGDGATSATIDNSGRISLAAGT